VKKFVPSLLRPSRWRDDRQRAARESIARGAGETQAVFDRRTGTVTAGNASQITDGAVALLVMSEQRASELGFTPLGALTGYAYAGCDPSGWGLARCLPWTRGGANRLVAG